MHAVTRKKTKKNSLLLLKQARFLCWLGLALNTHSFLASPHIYFPWQTWYIVPSPDSDHTASLPFRAKSDPWSGLEWLPLVNVVQVSGGNAAWRKCQFWMFDSKSALWAWYVIVMNLLQAQEQITPRWSCNDTSPPLHTPVGEQT